MKRNKLHFPVLMIGILILTFMWCENEPKPTQTPDAYTAYSHDIDEAEKLLAKQSYDSAYYYYTLVSTQSNAIEKPNRVIYALSKMAYIQQVKCDYAGSETSATEALKFFDSQTEPDYKIALYNILGINYSNLFDYKQAILYYNKAIQLTTDSLSKNIIQNNIAIVYLNQNNPSKAYSILSKLVTNKQIINSPNDYGRVLDNLGNACFKLNKPESIAYLEKGLKIRTETNNYFGQIASYINLAEYYKNLDPKQAQQYAKIAQQTALKIGDIDDTISALDLLIETSGKNETKKYALSRIQLSDSIGKIRQKDKNQFAKLKYDATKHKEENLLLKSQKTAIDLLNAQNKNKILVLSISVFGLVTVVFLLYYFWKRKNEKEKKVARYETETRISKKLHDELANDVYRTITFVETQNLENEDKKEILLENLDDIYHKTRNISIENSGIKTGIDFGTVFNALLMAFNSPQTNILVKASNAIDWSKITADKQIEIYRVAQELLTNMKKHSQASIVVFGFETLEKSIQIKYTDNGCGFDPENISKNGLDNMVNRIKSINGSITFDTQPNKGLKTTLLFPK